MSEDKQEISNVVQRARLLCGSLLAATMSYAVVGFGLVLFDLIPSGGFIDASEDIGVALNVMMVVAGILGAVASFPIKRVLASRIDPGQGPEARLKVAVTSMAIAESAGVLAIVSILATGEMGAAAILLGVAVGAGVFHFPTRAWLEGEA